MRIDSATLLWSSSAVKQFLIYLPFSLIFLYFVFQPAILIPFAHHDQYHYFFTPKSAYPHDFAFNWVAYGLARPVSALFEDIIFFHVHSLASLTLFRLLYICVAGTGMAILATCLAAARPTKLTAFFVSGAIFTLPVVAGLIALTNVENMIAVVLALLSYVVFTQVTMTSWRTYRVKTIAYAILAALLLLISMLIYPTMGYFFLVPLFYTVLASPLKDWVVTRRLVIKNVVFLGVLSIILYGIAKLLLRHYFKIMPPETGLPPTYKFQISFSLLTKLKSFLTGLLPTALNFWNIYTSNLIAIIVCLIIFSGALVALIKFRKSPYYLSYNKQAIRYVSEAALTVLLLIFISALFHFLGPIWTFFLFRTFFALGAVLLLLLIWSLQQWMSLLDISKQQRALTVVAGILYVLGAVFTGVIAGKSALNDNMEINYISAEIGKYLTNKTARIDVTLPYRSDFGFNGFPTKWDEFNIISTSGSLDVKGAIYLAISRVTGKDLILYDCGAHGAEFKNYQQQCVAKAPKGSIIISDRWHDDKTPTTPNTISIDMNNLFYLNVDKKDLGSTH